LIIVPSGIFQVSFFFNLLKTDLGNFGKMSAPSPNPPPTSAAAFNAANFGGSNYVTYSYLLANYPTNLTLANALTLKLSLSGGTMTGNIAMGVNALTMSDGTNTWTLGKGSGTNLQLKTGATTALTVSSTAVTGGLPMDLGANAFTCGAMTSGAITSSGALNLGANTVECGAITSTGAFDLGTNSIACGAVSSGVLTSTAAGANKLTVDSSGDESKFQIQSAGSDYWSMRRVFPSTNFAISDDVNGEDILTLQPDTGSVLQKATLRQGLDCGTYPMTCGGLSTGTGGVSCASLLSTGTMSCGTNAVTCGVMTSTPAAATDNTMLISADATNTAAISCRAGSTAKHIFGKSNVGNNGFWYNNEAGINTLLFDAAGANWASTLSNFATGTLAVTFASSGGGGTPSASKTLAVQRIGNAVIIKVPSFTCTTAGGAVSIVSSAALDAKYRPTVNTWQPAMVLSNGVTAAGMLGILATGAVELYYTIATGGFPAATANSGLAYDTSICYSVA
jgi:hypothetical protein